MLATKVITDLLAAVPDAVGDDGDGTWHVRKGNLAVAIDGDDELGSNDRVSVHLLRGTTIGEDIEVWNFIGEPFTATSQEAIRTAREFLS